MLYSNMRHLGAANNRFRVKSAQKYNALEQEQNFLQQENLHLKSDFFFKYSINDLLLQYQHI
jgi:hypothetical protein